MQTRLQLKGGAHGREHGDALDLDIKALNEQGEFEGYASTFGNVDRGGDIVLPGCFTESLAKRPASRVKMLLHHDQRRICGTWAEMAEDARGLRVKGKLLLTTTDGRETYELMRAGALDAMSIGYRTLQDEIDRTTGVRKIIRADLMEVSVVTFPMNERASVDGVKEGEESEAPTIRSLERVLMRDAGLSAAQAKAVLAGGYKSLNTARDAGESDDLATVLAIRRLEAAFRG